MSPKKEISSREHSTASLKKLREILANEPDAAKIFHDEQNRRWSMIAIEKRTWVCKLAGCAGDEGKRYSEIEKQNRAKIRSTLFRLSRLISEFDFAIKQG